MGRPEGAAAEGGVQPLPFITCLPPARVQSRPRAHTQPCVLPLVLAALRAAQTSPPQPHGSRPSREGLLGIVSKTVPDSRNVCPGPVPLCCSGRVPSGLGDAPTSGRSLLSPCGHGTRLPSTLGAAPRPAPSALRVGTGGGEVAQGGSCPTGGRYAPGAAAGGCAPRGRLHFCGNTGVSSTSMRSGIKTRDTQLKENAAPSLTFAEKTEVINVKLTAVSSSHSFCSSTIKTPLRVFTRFSFLNTMIGLV